ncbi:autophagy protein 13, partial [Halocaridina rubra]
DSSCRGYVHQQPERKVSVAFVDAKPPRPDDFFMPEIPFSNLLTSAFEVPQEKKTEKHEGAATPHPAQDKTAQERIAGGAAGGHAHPDTGERIVMTASDGSHKSTTSAQLKDESDFVMVELKTPFAMPSDVGSDLGAFYRECQSAPPLRMFADTPEDEISDLAEQLLNFEASIDDYNELVKSFHSDSPNSPD